MHWLIQKQETEQRVSVNHQIRDACFKLGRVYTEVDIVPFSHEIIPPFKGSGNNCIVYGSTAMIDIARMMNLFPGYSIWDESTTLATLGEFYLNSDMKSLPDNEVVHYVKEQEWDYFFAKPDKDLKSFDGTVFDVEKFPFFIEQAKQRSNYEQDTRICVSSLKEIQIEWRVFVVDQKIVTYSQYRKNRKLNVLAYMPDTAIHFTHSMVQQFNPARAYVIDICQIAHNEFRVIEYNTFNCSGVYDCDIFKIVEAIG